MTQQLAKMSFDKSSISQLVFVFESCTVNTTDVLMYTLLYTRYTFVYTWNIRHQLRTRYLVPGTY